VTLLRLPNYLLWQFHISWRSCRIQSLKPLV
jgi:hypothetical protein